MRFFLKWVEKNNKVRKSFSKIGFILNLGVSFLLLISDLAPFVPPDRFWPIAFFGLAFPYLVILNVIFLVFWALKRSKRFVLSLACLLIGFTNFTNTYQLIPGSNSTKSGIKVLSYNVHGFKSDQRAHRLNNPKIVEYFKSTGASIICLQEGTQFKTGKLSPQGIKEALPEINYFQVVSSGSYSDLVTFSKYPIINKGELKFPVPSILVQFSDIRISDRQIIRVYNCHLQSYSIDPDDYSVIDSIGSSTKTNQIEEARKVTFKLRNGFICRASQARKLAEHIRKSPYPVLVCGDFNDTPVSYAYRKVRGSLKDAFIESGWGTSNTYNGELPSFRIDYILLDQKFTVQNYHRDRVYYSDHFPIHCQISVE